MTEDLLGKIPWVIETIYEGIVKGEIEFGAIPKIVLYDEAVLNKFLRLLKFFSLQFVEEESLNYLYIIKKK